MHSDSKPIRSIKLPAALGQNPGRYLPRLLLAIGLLLVILGLGLKSWRIARLASSLQAQQEQVQLLLADGPMNVNADSADTIVRNVRRDVVALQAELNWLLPIAPYFGWLPRVGPMLAVAPQLATMADAGTESAFYLMEGLKPGLILLQQESVPGRSRLPALITVIDQAGPELQQAAQAMERLAAARAEIHGVQQLPWRLQTLLSQVDELLPVAQDGLQLAQVLPGIMGGHGQRSYLILAQNEDELRPTGGFISGAGLLILENGQILSLDFHDANVIDDWANKPYDLPPQPLYELMGSELFLFRDANFWPDFPTSAETAMQLYRYGQNTAPADGVIAIDQQFLQTLLQVVGPVYVPEMDETINGQNVIARLREAWSFEEDQSVLDWIHNRKSFMGPLAKAIVTRLETDPGSVDLLGLVRATREAAATRHLQIYIPDPAVAAVFNTLGWDGRLENETTAEDGTPSGQGPSARGRRQQDFLLVVDTNVGFNKANILIDTEIAYEVLLAAGGGQANLELLYRHRGEPVEEDCTPGTLYSGGVQYADIINDCYWNYLRVYVPPGSSLIAASQHPAPASAMVMGQPWHGRAQGLSDLSGLTVFANFLLLNRGQELSTNFTYQLPATVIQDQANGQQRYQLTVRKQAGTRAHPLLVTVTLPPGRQLINSSPLPITVNGQFIQFETDLDRDKTFVIIYQ